MVVRGGSGLLRASSVECAMGPGSSGGGAGGVARKGPCVSCAPTVPLTASPAKTQNEITIHALIFIVILSLALAAESAAAHTC